VGLGQNQSSQPGRRRIAVLTSGRQDWGILRSTCALLAADPRFELCLLVGGMHCEPTFGRTLRLIEAEGYTPAEELAWITAESLERPASQAGAAVGLIGEALARQRPEALMLVGDRFETLAAGLAATLERVPIVHLHGGEQTLGAFDNAFRNALTQMSQLHLVSHPSHAARVVSMGIDAETVHVVGAPGNDNLYRQDLPGRAELEQTLELRLTDPVVLVTFHPTTLGGDPDAEVQQLCLALDRVPATYVITLPNADPGNTAIRARLLTAADHHPSRRAVDALGERRYWGLLRIARALLGNSSSALIEGAAAGVPAVNVGDRQMGRLRGANVIDVPCAVDAIVDALTQALRPEFYAAMRDAPSPYLSGSAAERIVDILGTWSPERHAVPALAQR
jgi:UDP-hydrolysing UDP-N-acetyl-D-glucosamine 2-epimerase